MAVGIDGLWQFGSPGVWATDQHQTGGFSQNGRNSPFTIVRAAGYPRARSIGTGAP
jgi:hypothetical protein